MSAPPAGGRRAGEVTWEPQKPRGALQSSVSLAPAQRGTPDRLLPPAARPRPLGLRRWATAARRALLPSADLA